MAILGSARTIDWSLAGVWVSGVQGIPARETIYTTLSSGATLTQINSAISACPSGQTVKLGAGSYSVAGTINMKSGVTLRGAGPTLTTITTTYNGNTVQMMGDSGTETDTNITSGYTKGSQTIVVTSSAAFAVGDLVIIDQLNDPSFVTATGSEGTCSWCGRDNGARTLGEINRITSKSGTTLGLDKPLVYTYNVTYTPQICNMSANPIVNAGIEDMKIVTSGVRTSSVCVNFLWAYGCWAKNINAEGFYHKCFWIYAYDMCCEIRGCYGHDMKGDFGGDSGYVVNIQNQSSWNLIEDNIMNKSHTGIIIGSSGGAANVVSYNYCHAVQHTTGSTYWFIHAAGAHGAHTIMNLFEGNQWPKIAFDYTWGSGSHHVCLRNQIRGDSQSVAVSNNLSAIDVESWNSSISFIGNILGYPGYDGTLDWWNSEYYSLWYVSTQALVQNTLIRHGNYDYVNSQTTWDPDIEDHDIPSSYYLSSKPSWFGALSWPSIGPDVDGYVTEFPAKWRWNNYVESSDIADIFTYPPASSTGWTKDRPSFVTVSESETARLYVDIPKKRVVAGTDATYTVMVEPYADFVADITLDVTGLPDNATDSYGTNPIAYNGTTIVTIGTTDVAVGSYSMYITGTATGGDVANVRIILEIVDEADFELKVPVRRLRAKQGDNAVFTIQADAVSGYTSNIDLSVSGVPTGASSEFGASQIAYNGSTTLTIDTGTATADEYEITITGEGPV